MALVLAALLAVVDAGRRGPGRWRWNSPPRWLMQLMQIIGPELVLKITHVARIPPLP